MCLITLRRGVANIVRVDTVEVRRLEHLIVRIFTRENLLAAIRLAAGIDVCEAVHGDVHGADREDVHRAVRGAIRGIIHLLATSCD